MQNTSPVELRMQTITTLLQQRSLVFIEALEAAEQTDQQERLSEWKRLTAQIEALQ